MVSRLWSCRGSASKEGTLLRKVMRSSKRFFFARERPCGESVRTTGSLWWLDCEIVRVFCSVG